MFKNGCKKIITIIMLILIYIEYSEAVYYSLNPMDFGTI